MMERELTQEEMAAIGQSLAAGKKIEAIKRYREITGASLYDSKQFIERLSDELVARDPAFAARKGSSGCFGLVVVFFAIVTAIVRAYS